MPKPVKADHALFLTTLALSVLGVAMVFSASTVWATEKMGDANHLWMRQVMAGSLGMAILFLLMKLDYHNYQKPAFVFTALSVVIGLCVFVFFLPTTRNTHRWIQLPGLSFQPSEMAKLALVLFLAYFLVLLTGALWRLGPFDREPTLPDVSFDPVRATLSLLAAHVVNLSILLTLAWKRGWHAGSIGAATCIFKRARRSTRTTAAG